MAGVPVEGSHRTGGRKAAYQYFTSDRTAARPPDLSNEVSSLTIARRESGRGNHKTRPWPSRLAIPGSPPATSEASELKGGAIKKHAETKRPPEGGLVEQVIETDQRE
jgi:hypothetical protein